MARGRPSWCAPSSMRCRWRKRPGCPMRAPTRPPGRGARPSSPIAAGHDIHMASWVGTAKMLVGLKDRLAGHADVHRPARRRGRRGCDGDAERGPVSFAFASPMSASRCIQAVESFLTATSADTVGARSSSADSLFIRFKGRGGHGASPHATIDPIMMASRFVVDVQSVISREKDPTKFGVVSIGSFRSGTTGNTHSRRGDPAGYDQGLRRGRARQAARGDQADREGRRRDGGRTLRPSS